MKSILMQHELTEELEKRSGVKNLKLIRLKGYVPSWEVGTIRNPPIDDSTEKTLQRAKQAMQAEFDIA